MKSGFICIAGLPNAGKSTLINALVGEKVAIVSWRPQTTRNKILGIVNTDDAQMVFIDTPGIHQARNKLGEFMMQSVASGLKDVDGVLYVIDAAKGLQKEDYEFLEKYAPTMPVVVALNKQDAVTRDTLFACLEKLNSVAGLRAIVPVSAKKCENTEPLVEELEKFMPEGVAMFPEDMYTDSTLRFMAAEIIREKALYLLDKEVPYGIGVHINKFEMREDKPIYDIDADVVCEKQSHKSIIIGKQGAMLRRIGSQARADIENLLGSRIMLHLWVKVREDWRNRMGDLRTLGYDSSEEQ